jgi:hypothetical protein
LPDWPPLLGPLVKSEKNKERPAIGAGPVEADVPPLLLARPALPVMPPLFPPDAAEEI